MWRDLHARLDFWNRAAIRCVSQPEPDRLNHLESGESMRKLSVFTSIMLSLFIVATATAQVRGRGRLQGTVTDKTSAKPVQGATVTLAIASGNTSPSIVNTAHHVHLSAL